MNSETPPLPPLTIQELNHLFTLAHETICEDIRRKELDICRHELFRSTAVAVPSIAPGANDRGRAWESAKRSLDTLRKLEEFARIMRLKLLEKSAEDFAKEFKDYLKKGKP